MKSPRQRPPLNLTDPDPEAAGLADVEAAALASVRLLLLTNYLP